MKKFNPEKELGKIKNANKKKVIISICALLVVGILGYSFALYQVRHTQKLVFNTVGEFKRRDIILSVLVNGEPREDFPNQEEGFQYGGYECEKGSELSFDKKNWKVILKASHADKCTVMFGNTYKDESGANYPELYQGMIPVYFENGKIYVADVTSEWYNYDENKWANAVLIDNTNETIKAKFYDEYGNLRGHQEVQESDILQMYVWIPRYKYQLWNVNNEGVEKQLINIDFEEGTENTGNIKCAYTNNNDGTITEDCKDKNTQVDVKNGDWYTHPAFTFKGTFEENGTELKGIWVGKFEPSDPTDPMGTKNNEINEITILPNKISVIAKSISVSFKAVRDIEEQNATKYNLNSNIVDTHIMKNTDWGAVAYLTQSIYGIYKDKKTCNIDGMTFEECEVWINNKAQGTGLDGVTKYGGIATGCVGDSVKAQEEYNKEDGAIVECADVKKWNANGVKASTTGNMYGIYDMSGGIWEYVMGIIVNQDGTDLLLGGSGFQTSSPDLAGYLPDSKYYDVYGFSDSMITHERGHLGDATREILENFRTYPGGWNKNVVQLPNSNGVVVPWFIRGGGLYHDINRGLFASSFNTGMSHQISTFRSVLTAV